MQGGYMDLVDVSKGVKMRMSTFNTRVRTLNSLGIFEEFTVYSVLLASLIRNFHAILTIQMTSQA